MLCGRRKGIRGRTISAVQEKCHTSQNNLLMCGDARTKLALLPSESVHTIITSPPYFKLRDYGVKGQIGLENTAEEYIESLLTVFRDCHRVLRKDGTLWVVIGDSYDKRKSLIGIPWMLMFALKKMGFYWRCDAIWNKPNGKPESVKDRPIRTHEYVLFFSKSRRYYFDEWAIQEPFSENEAGWLKTGAKTTCYGLDGATEPGSEDKLTSTLGPRPNTPGRRKRSVWNVNTEASSLPHYGAYPRRLIEPCVLASTSEKGCCSECGTPLERIFEDKGIVKHGGKRKLADAPGAKLSENSLFTTGEIKTKNFVGWRYVCKHIGSSVIPCTVLDPFSGTGTTGEVSMKLFRRYIGIELNPRDIEITRLRLQNIYPLFTMNSVEVVA